MPKATILNKIFILGLVCVPQLVKNLSTKRETWVQSLGLEFLWRRERLPTPVFCSGEFHGQRSLEGYSPWDLKESDATE